MSTYDIFVIGGGVNGCGIARDAAGRGFSVFLAEKDDLASGTSSRSTKLIHGGLRYLEYYEFRLVHEALVEREVLWTTAPHVIWPLRFVLPHHRGLRPAFVLRTGLFMYDNMGGRKLLPPTRELDLGKDPIGQVLRPGFSRAYEYSDCWADDARLVALLARDAADRGAIVRTRTEVVGAERANGVWQVSLVDRRTGHRETITARMLVNAAGPWVDKVLPSQVGSGKGGVRLVGGSHIVVPRLHADPRCFFFQNKDGRILFVIPYEEDFSLIGTTDNDFAGSPDSVSITPEEVDYLCKAVGEYVSRPVRPEDVVWSYSGVRPLYDDGASKAQEATRDYVLQVLGSEGEARLLKVIGGKLTTFRKLAESALERIETVLGKKGRPWTDKGRLPGGDFAPTAFQATQGAIGREYPFLQPQDLHRLVRSYGTLARTILGSATSYGDLGQDFGAGLTEAEVRYLADREWAETTDDVLWRRSKRGLREDRIDMAALESFLGVRAGERQAAE